MCPNKRDLNLIKFNLTQGMSLELIKFNNLKKEIHDLKKLYNLDKNKDLLLKIQNLEKELINCRNKFIVEFRSNNRKEITEYLKIKDQI